MTDNRSGLELVSRILAASVASTVATVIVTPLDVVKTRMQSAAGSPPHTAYPIRYTAVPSSTFCVALRSLNKTVRKLWYNGIQGPTLSSCPSCSSMSSLAVSPCCAAPGATLSHAGRAPSIIVTLRSIVHQDGWRLLWKGLDTSLLMAIPMVGIYMPLYDHLRVQLEPLGAAAPPVAGMAARTAAVLATAPLELVRTRQQASLTHSSTVWRSLLSGSGSSGQGRTSSATGLIPRVSRMWTGVGATLARDVPFTALYWLMVEPIRGYLVSQPAPGSQHHAAESAAESGTGISKGAAAGFHAKEQQPSTSLVLWANLTAGGVAGGLAAAATTPFDVAKTRLQTAGLRTSAPRGSHFACHQAALPAGSALGTWGTLQVVLRTEGVRGLFTGTWPRSARAAPACAIVIASYEVLKIVLQA